MTLYHSSNLMGNSNDETDFPHKFLLTDTQVSKICQVFPKTKLAKIQVGKIIQLGKFMCNFLHPLLHLNKMFKEILLVKKVF